MKLSVNSFRGEAPRLTPRSLPGNAAQAAINCRMQTGDLESWRQHLNVKQLANTGPVQTIYLLNDKWLSWDDQVDVARSVIPGDASFRVYLTSPGLYDTPRWTDYDMATTGAEPYPVATRPIGVPGPDTAPTAVPGVDPNPTTLTVNVTDNGDELATSWIASPDGSPHLGDSHVRQSSSLGNPLPSYEVSYGNNSGVPAYLHRNVGVGGLSAVSVSFDFMCRPPTSGETYRQMIAKISVSEVGEGIHVSWGPAGFSIATGSGWNSGGSPLVNNTAIGLPTLNAWYTCTVTTAANADSTTVVTATLFDDTDTQIAQITTTNSFVNGDYVGFVGETSVDSADSPYWSYYDNLVVQGSGSTGYNPQLTATSYVYTFVNDIGQESAPSAPSATVLRPDGISITVTTPTDVPVGTDPDYNITDKRIYRAVTGSGGTAYLRVAVIPLAQADFVDTLTDEQAGPQVLESEDWDLPPDGLEGIRALPNGIMCGFVGNELCFSEQDRPHAWPIKYRKTTDTDIVGISNMDTTVFIGTKSYPYTASGNTPGGYSMSLPGEAQACVAKLGVVFLDGQGVAFPSPDGYQLCRGSAGSLVNMTSGIFTRRQWQALKPESIIAAVHDAVLHWFYDDGPTPPAGPATLFLDTFTGSALTPVDEHTQDTRLESSVWVSMGETSVACLDGDGAATRNADSGGQGGMRTDFGSGVTLVPGWRAEIDLTPLSHVADSSNAQSRTVITIYDNDVGAFVISFKPNTGELGSELRITYPGSDDLGGWGVFDGYTLFVITFDETGYTLSLNGISQGTIACACPMRIDRFQVLIGTDFDTEGNPSATIDRVMIYGERAA